MDKILLSWYASQNEFTKAILKKVVAKKMFTIIKIKGFSFVEI